MKRTPGLYTGSYYFLRVSGFAWRVTLFRKIPPLPKRATHSDQDAGTIQLDPNPGIEVPIATAIGTFMIECTEMVDLGGTEGSVAPGSSGRLSRISRRWARPTLTSKGAIAQ
jgi:hypothetical protein